MIETIMNLSHLILMLICLLFGFTVGLVFGMFGGIFVASKDKEYEELEKADRGEQ